MSRRVCIAKCQQARLYEYQLVGSTNSTTSQLVLEQLQYECMNTIHTSRSLLVLQQSDQVSVLFYSARAKNGKRVRMWHGHSRLQFIFRCQLSLDTMDKYHWTRMYYVLCMHVHLRIILLLLVVLSSSSTQYAFPLATLLASRPRAYSYYTQLDSAV